jgi:uncharacterized repeat protein (TIGR03803 family)
MSMRDRLGRWFGRAMSPTRQALSRQQRRTRLCAELLEPHCVPALITLASFNGSNGASPWAGLTLDSSGNLFGATQTGGLHSDGVVFLMLPGSGTILPLAAFDGTNGLYPNGVVEDSGDLFGTTLYRGSSNWGTVFEVKQGSGMITSLASFTGGADGGLPYSRLTEDAAGNLFGTTTQGGWLRICRFRQSRAACISWRAPQLYHQEPEALKL